MSAKALHSVLLNETVTAGVKLMQGEFPVFPPTQLPQLSMKAVPFGVELQSNIKFSVAKVSTTDHAELGEVPGEQKAFACQI